MLDTKLPVRTITEFKSNVFVVRFFDFATGTNSYPLYSDSFVELSAYKTESRERLVGYKLTLNGVPVTINCDCLLYATYKRENLRENVRVVYRDANIRLVNYDEEYAWALHMPKVKGI